MDTVIVTDNVPTLDTVTPDVNSIFGMLVDPTTNALKPIELSQQEITQENIDDFIDTETIKTQQHNKDVINKIKSNAPNTTLSDQQLLDMYSDMTSDDMIVF